MGMRSKGLLLAGMLVCPLAQGEPAWLVETTMAFQLELIDFVIDYHGPTPVGEYVETQCRTRSGIFQ